MVLRAVVTCLSMKPLDLGYRGNDVMWSVCCFCINLARSSDEKVGPFSVNIYLGGLYCEIRSCNFCVMNWVVLDEALFTNR